MTRSLHVWKAIFPIKQCLPLGQGLNEKQFFFIILHIMITESDQKAA